MLLTATFGIYLLLLAIVAYDDLAVNQEEYTLKA